MVDTQPAPAVEGARPDPGSDMADKVVSASLLLVVRRGGVLVATGLSTAVVARVLAPGAYGTLQAALAAWSIVLALADFGFSLVMTRELAAEPELRARRLRTAYEVQGLWCVLVTALMVLFGVVLSRHSDEGILLLILAPSVLATAVSAGRALHLAIFDTGRLMRIDVGINVVQNVAMIVVALVGGGAVWLAVVVSAGTAINALWVGAVALRRVGVARAEPHQRVSLFRRVLPLGVMGIVSKIYLSIDLVILGLMVHGQSLGNYAGAVKIINLLNTIPAILVGMALPGVATVWGDREATVNLCRRTVQWLVIVLVPMFLAVALWPEVPISLALGSDYRGAHVLVVILSLSGMIAVFSQLFGNLLVAAKVIRPMVIQNLVAVTFNVAANYALIPTYGAAASAWVTVATEAIVCLGSLWTLRRVLPLREVFADARRPAAVLVVTTLVGVVSGHFVDVLLSIVVTTVVFVGCVVALRCWPQELTPRLTSRRAA